MIDNSDGRRWARFTLALALLMSVAGNVLHTVLTESTVHLALRIPPAVLWPVFTFLGIEVLVRIVWERSLTHRLARNMVLLPAIPAAIVSYEHLYSLLKLMGERDFIALIGPAAIDGTMIGMTMVLLFTRKITPQPEAAPAPILAPVFQYAEPLEPMPVPAVAEIEEIKPISPAAPRAPRASRAIEWDMRKACEMAVDGEKGKAIADAVGISPALAGRFVTVARKLRADPGAEINTTAEKIRPEGVRIMKELISR